MRVTLQELNYHHATWLLVSLLDRCPILNRLFGKAINMKAIHMQRRQFLKIGGTALAAIPVLLISGQSLAATNAAMRGGFKYQDKPEGDKSCANCVQFVPGATAKDLGGCKIIPGDTEIAPHGYCIAWTKKA